MYPKNTVYIVGHAKTNTDNAITEQFKMFFISFVVDITTDEIVDLGCSATLGITRDFIKSIFMGRTMDTDINPVEVEVTHRYFGSSQRAIVVAHKDAVKKYLSVKSKYY